MQGREIIKAIMEEGSISYAELGRRTNTSQINVRQRLVRQSEEHPKDLTVSLLVKYAEALGYEVVIRKKSKKAKEGEYIIGEE